MDFLSLLTSIPSMISNFSGTAQPYRREQEQLAARQNQLSQAMTDTNNPLYQQIYGQYQQQNRNNIAQMIAEAQGQNRMNANMGRTPLFNQERGSENIFRSMMQQYQNMGTQSAEQTRAALGQAMGGAGQAMQGYNQLTPYRNMQTAQKLQPYKDIYSLLNGGQGAMGSTGSMGAGNYSGEYDPMSGQRKLTSQTQQQPNAFFFQ